MGVWNPQAKYFASVETLLAPGFYLALPQKRDTRPHVDTIVAQIDMGKEGEG